MTSESPSWGPGSCHSSRPPPLSSLSPQGFPSSLSFLSPSPSQSLPVSPSLCLLHFSNSDHFPGCFLPSSPSAEGRSLPIPLSLCFLRFLFFLPATWKKCPCFSGSSWLPLLLLGLCLSYSAWACLGPITSCPLALSHFRAPPSPVSPPPSPFFQFLGAPDTISPALKSFPASFR